MDVAGLVDELIAMGVDVPWTVEVCRGDDELPGVVAEPTSCDASPPPARARCSEARLGSRFAADHLKAGGVDERVVQPQVVVVGDVVQPNAAWIAV